MDVKPPVLVGVAAALLVLLAALLAPYMRSSERRTAEKAQEQAQLALRELARVDLSLPRIDKLADTAAIGPAVNKALQAPGTEGTPGTPAGAGGPGEPTSTSSAPSDDAGRSALLGIDEELRRISTEYTALLGAAAQRAKQRGLTPPAVRPMAPTLNGAQLAAADLLNTIKLNNTLLSTAISDAQAAVTSAGALNPVGVAHVLGMAEYVQATGLLAESVELRRAEAHARARLLWLGEEWKLAQGYLDHYRGLDVVPILARLRDDLKELSGLKDEANAAVATLQEQVQKTAAALKQVEDELAATQQELLTHEEKGFVAGQDESFNAYRTRYRELTQRLQALQQQQQELKYGGLRGAELRGEDITGAEIQGGETIVGLEELNRRLATAQEKAQRLERANVSLDEHIKYVTESGRQAEADAKRYEERMADLAKQQDALADEVNAANTAAFNQENAALVAAKAAIEAFAKSQRAIEDFVAQKREVQSTRDKDRRNRLLDAIVNDAYLRQIGSSSEAAAHVLEGRIHAQRATSYRRMLDDMRLYGELYPKAIKFNAAPFQEVLDTAQVSGQDTLGKARDIYERLSGGPERTAWVPLAALAAVHHLMARVDPTQASLHTGKAAEYISKAVKDQEQSPYLAPYVLFRDHLGGATTKPAGEEEEEATDEPTTTQGQ